ncbi:hypothetical protein K439DRAFT_1632398 [Ramaria rubella]|nr:hypothetical protein K439DRAFT_1632398 [Ramaria rubella]
MEEQSASPKHLHALPVELVRIILEIEASRSTASALNLMFLSRTVQAWILPILYHTVVIESPSSLISFYETMQGTRSFGAHHLRALYLPSPPSPSVPPSFLDRFLALQHLAISSLSLRDSPQSPQYGSSFPRPASITITGPMGRVSFRHPIFQRCTHLYLSDDVPGPFALTADVLPCLTHLACAYRHGTSSTTAVTCLPLLLAQMPADQAYSFTDNDLAAHAPSYRTTPVELKVLIIELYLSNGSSDSTMFVMERLGLGKTVSESQLRADPRLVLRPGKPLTPGRWERYVVNNVMWAEAEQEIKLQSALKTST